MPYFQAFAPVIGFVPVGDPFEAPDEDAARKKLDAEELDYPTYDELQTAPIDDVRWTPGRLELEELGDEDT